MSDAAGGSGRAFPVDEQIIEWPGFEEACAAADIPALVPDELPEEQPHYLVYLSGIGMSTPEQLPVVEIPMVEHLTKRLGGTKVVWQVCPYAVRTPSLIRRRRSSRFWAAATRWKFEKNRLRYLAALINVRNGFQLFVSADRRVTRYNRTIARRVAEALVRAGYVPENRRPITLLGWSGGAQVAAGVARHLGGAGTQVRIMSMAGIISADPGLGQAEHIWHLRGDHDAVEAIGATLAVRRWPLFRHSPWNQALGDGRLEIISMGSLTHTGDHGYYSAATILPDGRTPRQYTADAIVATLCDAGLATDNGEVGWEPVR